jgi:hypothetical protein
MSESKLLIGKRFIHFANINIRPQKTKSLQALQKMFCKLNCKLQKAIRAHYVIRHKHALGTKKNDKTAFGCTMTITLPMTKQQSCG